MTGLGQRAYWLAPYFLKRWMASWSARRLDGQRYGPEYDAVLSEIRERDGWSAEQFAAYQNEALRRIVQLAGEHVPYYQRRFAEAGISPQDIRGVEDLSRLPILEKNVVREFPTQLLNQTLDRASLILLHTSGTTGTPLDLYRDRRLSATACAYFDARCHAVAGMQRRVNRSVSIGGHLVAPPWRTRPPFWVYNARWRQLYMSSSHLAPQYLDAYVDAIREFAADYIEGYPSSVYAIARHIVDQKLEPVRMKACFTTAETLLEYQRDAISGAFCCWTYDQYGCGEMAVFAAECREGSLHLSPEYGIVEVLDAQDRPVLPGEVGQLVCTSLVNHVQPFLRYRLGDLGCLLPGRCRCGSEMPMLGQIEGRIDAVLVTRDGRRIGRLDPVFKGARGIVEAQVVQDDLDRFRIRIVPAKDYTDNDGRVVAANLAHRIGGGDIRVEVVPAIERTAAGKFQAVVSLLPRPSAAAASASKHDG
ncbi:MAG TPA: hypothetical protein PLL20_13485 [Phycisphaerae bacterium]|nr:hypothetical protein [Phycisphaerae bacterium]HRR84503.1 hypothetical protein [Phycisphaerae bacterium]